MDTKLSEWWFNKALGWEKMADEHTDPLHKYMCRQQAGYALIRAVSYLHWD